MLATMVKEFIPRYSASLVRQLTNFLTNEVVEGRLKEGERLYEAGLQRRFGISRGPIRESFRILEKNGLLVTTPRRGTFVRNITSEYVLEVFPIRANLEGLAARLATPRLGDKDLERMESILSRMIEFAKQKDVKSFARQHYEYHKICTDSAMNETLNELLGNLRHQAMWFLFSSAGVQTAYQYKIGAHRNLLDLLKKRDANGAEALVREHIMASYDQVNYTSKSNTGKHDEGRSGSDH